MGLAIIGGSGLARLEELEIVRRTVVRTRYGEPSGPLVHGRLDGREVIFLARHGHGHIIPPHRVNYRANLWALRKSGVDTVIAVAAVGAIDSTLPAPSLVLPDQIIDYTHSREGTYFDEEGQPVRHVDFTGPYCERLRVVLEEAAGEAGVSVRCGATYAATQGPRFESAAEIDRLERDGAHIVGMTGMPEAALARELELCYAALAVVANPAAGRGSPVIDVKEVARTLEAGMKEVRRVLRVAVPRVVQG